jgi:multiple sugar transport system permease protein
MKDAISKGTIYVLLSLGAVLMLFPFLWMISTSLMTPAEINAQNPRVLIPSVLQWENFARAMEVAPFDRFFINSVIVTVIGTVGELITTVLAAFAFSKMTFWGKDILFALLLGTMMVPNEVLLIPNFVTMANLGLIDTLHAIYMPWLASVFSIFLIRQFFMGIPKQLSFAAKVDGCSDFKFLWYVMIPLAKPALITMTLLTVINSWNAFTWPLLVTLTRDTRTLPVGLAMFRGEAGTFFELIMAASVVTVIPMIILFIILQKYVVAGVARSGIKG